jgi:hypothetical protein
MIPWSTELTERSLIRRLVHRCPGLSDQFDLYHRVHPLREEIYLNASSSIPSFFLRTMATDPPTRVTGGCLCNSITYALTGPPIVRVLCHCTDCQKFSGSAFSSSLVFMENQISVSDPNSHLKFYTNTKTDSGNPVLKGFCSNCGSSVLTKPQPAAAPASDAPQQSRIVVVCSGGVDNITELEKPEKEGGRSWAPVVEVYCGADGSRRRAWLPEMMGEGMMKFEGMLR